MPPKQSDVQKEIFARMDARAANDSQAVLPALTELIDFCAKAEPELFSPKGCPGLADLTDNGTLAPYPTAGLLATQINAAMCVVVAFVFA